MNVETRKIAVACFLGGVVYVAGLILIPNYWYLAVLAGFAAGYLGYEFEEALKACPRAWRKAGKVVDKNATSVKGFLLEPHPIMYPALVPVGSWFLYSICILFGVNFFNLSRQQMGDFFSVGLFVCLLFSLVVCVVLYEFMRIGAREEGFYFLTEEGGRPDDEALKKGHSEKPLTYTNGYRWLFKGWCIWWSSTALPILKVAPGVLWGFVLSALTFPWFLFRFIHKQERVLCGVDGVLGGICAYYFFSGEGMSLPQYAFLLFMGGVIGAALGILNYELVSVRWLKLVPRRA